MEPFVAALDAFHERTAPADWLEGLVKAYVGDGIAARLLPRDQRLRRPEHPRARARGPADTGHAEFAVDAVRAGDRRPTRGVAGRLALWGRRLVGEALRQAQRVAAERDALSTALLVGGGDRPGADLAELGRMFARLTEAHTSG